MKTQFVNAWVEIEKMVHDNAKAHGFWDHERNDGEAIALIHSELSEALEAIRHGNPMSSVCECSHVEEELADVVIRIMDLARERGWKIPEAVIAKAEYNIGRPMKHGKKF